MLEVAKKDALATTTNPQSFTKGSACCFQQGHNAAPGRGVPGPPTKLYHPTMKQGHSKLSKEGP